MSILVDEDEPLFDVEDQPFEPRDVKVRNDVWVTAEFEILDFLGRGKFGEVKRCKEKHSNKEFAAKFICAARPQDKKDVEHEIKIMQKLQHKRLLQLYDAFAGKTEMCLVLEIILGGELFDRVILDDFILTERACICFVRQICEGIDYMHSKSIVHLDLKPENILCLSKTGNRIKIIDFGLAREYNPKKDLRVLFGTPEFMAPEVVQYDPISPGTDMWSVGVICYVLLSGLSPFMGENDGETLANVTKGEVEFDYEEFEDVSEDGKNFMRELLVKRPRQRLNAEACLNHAWLKRPKKFNRQLNMSKKRLKKFVYRRKWQKFVKHRKFIVGRSLFKKISHYKEPHGRVNKNKRKSRRKKVVNAIIALKRMGVPLTKLKRRVTDEKYSFGESLFGYENRRSTHLLDPVITDPLPKNDVKSHEQTKNKSKIPDQLDLKIQEEDNMINGIPNRIDSFLNSVHKSIKKKSASPENTLHKTTKKKSASPEKNAHKSTKKHSPSPENNENKCTKMHSHSLENNEHKSTETLSPSPENNADKSKDKSKSPSPEPKKLKSKKPIDSKIKENMAKFTPKLEVNSMSIHKKSKAFTPMRGKEIEFNELSCSKFRISNLKKNEPIIEENSTEENFELKPYPHSRKSQRKSSSDNESGSRGMKARPTGERIDISNHINDAIFEKQNISFAQPERDTLSPTRYWEDHDTPYEPLEPTILEDFHEDSDKVVLTGLIKCGKWSGKVISETFIKTVNYTFKSFDEIPLSPSIECNQNIVVYEASLTVK